MSCCCEFTGTKALVGNKVSHANNKSKMRQFVNLKTKRYFVEPFNHFVSVRLTTRAMRTIDKQGGFVPALLNACECSLSQRLQRLRRELVKSSSTAKKAK